MENKYVLKGKNKKTNTSNFIFSKYNIFYGFLFFVLVFGLSSSIIASDASKDNNIVKMSFSDNHDLLAQNEMKKSYVLQETKFLVSKQSETKDILINISQEECELYEIDEWHYLKVGNLASFTKPGDPQLPVKTFVIKLPKNSEVMDVSVISGNYKEILNEINILPTPQPLKLTANKNISEENYKQIYNSEIYNSNSYFPGKIFSYDIGDDNENKYILIRFYPIQYMPQEKNAVLITNAKIEVSYQTTNDASSALLSSAEAVIITSPELKTQADNLAAFHNSSGIPTDVVTTQYIWNNYAAASDPGYEGYKDSFLPGRNNITKYNYTLAKKIISYLNQSSNIKYVILFGNTMLVPPSYYIYDKQTDCGYCGMEECSIDYYNSWVPTDYFYSSPDYDLIPNYMVGRIPVNNTTEAGNFVQKINNWNLNLNWSWFKNVAVAGGRPFLDTVCGSTGYDERFTGEMSSTDIINKGYFSGMNITKLFRSDNKFNKSGMKDVLSGNYGLVYHVDHGAGDRLVTDKESLNTSDIMSLSTNSKVPVVVSVACMDGAYDAYLMPNDLYGYAQTMSIGESIIKSNAGGIAYIGGSRTNYGGPSLYLKNGYVQSLKERYMIEMNSNIFKAYHGGSNSIGNLTKSAVLQYVIDNDFSEDPYNKRTLFEFVLLGDPALKIPIQQSEEYSDKPKLNVVNPQGKRDSYFAYGNIPTYSSGTTVTVTCQANSSTVKMKLIAIDKWFNETIDVQNVNVVNGNATYTFTINDAHLYLVRCIDNNSKEGWLYVNQPFVTFTNFYSSEVGYIDSDVKYDYLTINVGVNVKKAGEYLISGNLCDKISCVSTFSKINPTSSGIQTIKLKFNGHEIYKLKMNGYYQLKYLTLYNNKGPLDYMPIDYRYNPYNTSYYYYYSDFEPEVSKTAYISSSTYTDADAGMNTDSTSYYNYLITNVTVYVKKAGYYNVGGVLYGYDLYGYDYKITRASNYTYLNEGYQTVSLKFDGRLIYYWGNFYNGATTQYDLLAMLSDSDGNLLNYKFLQTNSNYNYNNFERLKDIFVSYLSLVIDTNGNGKNEYLTFTARVNIPSSGYYGIGASLYDSKYHQIDSAFTVENLTPGYHYVQLNFSGWKIHSNGYNGQYKILGLYIADEYSILDFERNPHSTVSYSYTSFESTPWKILLVDDDNCGQNIGCNDYEDDYKDALDANEYSYKYWDVYYSGSPSSSDLSSYDVVIWFTGKDNSTTLTSTDQTNLQSYLDAGGKLFISGQGIGLNIGTTSFYQNYLHAIYRGDNKNTGEITGISGDFISNGLDINLYGNSPDVISVKSDAVKIFDYVGGSYSYSSYPAAGLRYDGKYKLVYLPFGFEFASKQHTLMDRVIKWLLQPTAFKNYADYGEDTDGDGLHNYLMINVTLNVTNAGNYTIGGYLFDQNLKYIDDYETSRYLNTGIQTVQLKFNGYEIYNNGVSGNYQLKFLNVENVDDVYKYPVDYAINPYSTSSYLYTAFDRTFTGNYAESTANIYEEEGAKYRYLTMNVSVNITSAGNYMISGELYDNNSLFITKAGNFTYLNSGIQTVKLNFKGFDIYHNEANGKYYLKALLIKNIGETIDYKETAYTTSPYAYSHFKIAVCLDGTMDGQCSTTKPKYCLNGTFIDNCSLCGCLNGQNCNVTNGSCYVPIRCNCSDCNDCTDKLNNLSCAIVALNWNITNHSGTCINNPVNFTNRIFDCQRNTIDGDDLGNDYGIYLSGKQNNTIRNCIITDFSYGIYLNSSSNNAIIGNTLNSNNKSGIYIFNNSNFNQISNNQISNNTETGITISNCNTMGNCYKGNSNNTIKRNKISNNAIGIFSNASNSTINNNVVSNNTNFDLYSSYWPLSYGDNNYCDKPDGWNDTVTTGCRCKDQDKAKDIFDAVEMLEYLSGQKDLSKCETYYNLNEDDDVNLPDVFALIAQIVTEG